MKRQPNQDKTLFITQEQKGFDLLTRNISRNNKLSDGAIRLYAYLNSHSENFNLSAQSIANYLHKSIRTINTFIAELKQSGFLVLDRKENSNTYYYKLMQSPKLEEINDFSKENVLNAYHRNVIDGKDLLLMLRKNLITRKTYDEIITEIIRIANTPWLDDED